MDELVGMCARTRTITFKQVLVPDQLTLAHKQVVDKKKSETEHTHTLFTHYMSVVNMHLLNCMST